MSLKYRLILLTVTVFAIAFGAAAVLGMHGARALAEHQLSDRLDQSARALAASGAPLNDAVLSRLAPLLQAELLVIDVDESGTPTRSHHSGAALPWEELTRRVTDGEALGETITIDHRTFFVAEAFHTNPPGGGSRVLALADESVAGEATRTIRRAYLTVLAATVVLLAGGTYLVGLALVRRVNRLARDVDATLSENFVKHQRSGDELARLSAAFDDLRERLDRSLDRLARQQRLATTGKLASSITHEVRNPLQAMRLTVQMLTDRARDEDREGLELIGSEIDRLALLTDELLVLAGKDTHTPESLDLSEQLDATLRLLKHQLHQRGLKVDVDLPDPPPVRMDRNRCRQLLLNLLLNAAEASPTGGTIRINGEGGERVAFRIADEGPGLPDDVLAESPEELFSTKSTGAGLGLSICRRIVTEAGGQLELYNTDTGATAEVRLPVDS